MTTQVTVVSTKGEVGTTIPAHELDEADPIELTPMAVPIDRILEYDRNPRRERNEAYDEIETSIRRRGFVGMLPITRRPGEPHYRVAEGGCSKGCGFLVDLPAEPLCATGRPATVKEVERLTIWWLLSTFADQWPFGPGVQGVPALAHLEDSRMYPVLQAAATEDATTLSSILVPFVDEPPMFARLCQYLFAVLEDRNFEIVMRLIETRWALQAHCRRLGKKWVWDL